MNNLFLKTPVNLPESLRERMVDLLNQQLADAIDLQLQSRQAQWNVSGAQFLTLHLFFDQIAKRVEEAAGEIAERVAQLGGTVQGTKRAVMETSRLPEYPLNISRRDEHMSSLHRALASFLASVREAVRTTCEAQDFNSTDVLAHVWQTTDKLLWMVNSYVQRRRQGLAGGASSYIGANEEEGKAA